MSERDNLREWATELLNNKGSDSGTITTAGERILDLLDEVELLQANASRWAFVRDNLAQMHSPHMNGMHSYRFRPLRGRGPTVDEAVDNQMREDKA